MSSHTPGPWEVALGQRTDGDGAAYYEIRTDELSDLARFYFDPTSNEERGTALADAELAAAAPELRNALDLLLRTLERCRTAKGQAYQIAMSNLWVAVGTSRAALAKSGGSR